MYKSLLTLLCLLIGQSLFSQVESKVIYPIELNPVYLSGIDLQPVKDPKQPDRLLFQRRLFRGEELSVYIVSSGSATAFHESYGIDELIYLINGGARLQPINKEEEYQYTGDFFIAPKGYRGDWETIGAPDFHHELSVISTARNKNEVDKSKLLPISITREKLSGILKSDHSKTESQHETLIYEGHEITVHLHQGPSVDKAYEQTVDQLIYILAGYLELSFEGEPLKSYYAGDFVILPKGMKCNWKSYGHSSFRYLTVSKSDWE